MAEAETEDRKDHHVKGDAHPNRSVSYQPEQGESSHPREQRPGGLARRAVGGLATVLAQNAVARVLSLLTQLVLALLLTPADFGLVGLTYSIVSIVGTIVNIGLDDVILQRRDALRLWAGALFWITLGLSSAAAILVASVSPIFAHIYAAPSLIGLICLVAISMPLTALSIVPATILRAQLKFGVLAVYTSCELTAQAIMTVGLAWAGFGALSLVLPLPVLVLVRAAVYWTLINPPTLRPHIRRWRYIIGDAAASSVTRMLVAVIGQGDYLILGLLAEKSVVGIYYFAFRLAAQPLWMMAGNFAGVLFPVFSQISRDPERQRSATVKAATNLSYLIMPLAFLQCALAAPLMGMFFSKDWAPSVPIVQILSVGLAFDALSWIAETALRARREFRVIMWYFIIQTPIFFSFVTLGAWWDGALGTAIGVALYYIVTQPIFVCMTLRRLDLSVGDILPLYLKPLVLSVLAVGTGYLVSQQFSQPIVVATVCFTVGSALYIGLMIVFARSAWSEIRTRVSSALPGRSR